MEKKPPEPGTSTRFIKLPCAALLILAVAASTASCQQTEITHMKCPGYDTATQDAQDVVAVDAAVGELALDGDGELPQGPRPTGAACQANDDCATQSCFTKEFLADIAEGFGVEWTYDIPGGMCSMLFCDPAKTTQCGSNGFCFDVAPLFGAEGMTIGLCLASCEDYSDCRYLESYICYFTGVPGETKACLPANIVADIPCGDGKCSEADNETPDSCPRDCK